MKTSASIAILAWTICCFIATGPMPVQGVDILRSHGHLRATSHTLSSVFRGLMYDHGEIAAPDSRSDTSSERMIDNDKPAPPKPVGPPSERASDALFTAGDPSTPEPLPPVDVGAEESLARGDSTPAGRMIDQGKAATPEPVGPPSTR